MSAALASIKSLVVDMDGVLWRGGKPLAGVADFFRFLSEREIPYLLATNNAARSADYYVGRLSEMGITMSRERILTSADATARWLTHELPRGARVYVVGESGLTDSLVDAGFQVVEGNAAAVVVGLDRTLTYEKLKRAALEIRYNGARFIATNGDFTYPAEEGLVPGAGSMVAAIQTASSATPTIIGKPHRAMFDLALEILKTPREQTAMLGDRLDTDIEGARAAGLTTILVLTGVSTREEAEAAKVKPDMIYSDLNELREHWQTDR